MGSGDAGTCTRLHPISYRPKASNRRIVKSLSEVPNGVLAPRTTRAMKQERQGTLDDQGPETPYSEQSGEKYKSI